LPFIQGENHWAGFDLMASDEIPTAVADTIPPVIISGLEMFKIISYKEKMKNETIKLSLACQINLNLAVKSWKLKMNFSFSLRQ